MIEAVKFLLTEGEKYGYKINPRKGAYLMGARSSPEIAYSDKNYICDSLGLYGNVYVNPKNVQTKEEEDTFGTKVLGSYIGSQEYIRNSLAKEIVKIRATADKLLEVKSHQCRYVLYKNSYSYRLSHLFKVTDPKDIAPIVPELMNIDKMLIASLLEINPSEISDEDYALMHMSVENGGIGVMNIITNSLSYYLGTILEQHNNSWNKIWQTKQEMLTHPFLHSFLEAAAFMNIPTDWLLRLEYYPNLGSIYRQICARASKNQLDAIRNTLKNSEKGNWHLNICSEECGAWLNAKPSYEKLCLSNQQFSNALRYRYYIKAKDHIDGSICICGKALDKQGVHVATCCSHGGQRQQTHNSIVHELNSILHYCGKHTRIEDRYAFSSTDPSCRLTPDITIFNSGFSGKSKLHIDVSVATPSFGGKIGHAGEMNFRAKSLKYKTISESSGSSFLPFILQSTGHICDDSKSLLKYLSKTASSINRIPIKVLYNYFLKRLSLSLQRGISNSLTQRYAKINAHYPVHEDSSFHEDVVYNS